MYDASAGCSGEPNVIIADRQRPKIELASGHVRQLAGRRGPREATVARRQHQATIADEPAAGLTREQQPPQRSRAEARRSRRPNLVRRDDTKTPGEPRDCAPLRIT